MAKNIAILHIYVQKIGSIYNVIRGIKIAGFFPLLCSREVKGAIFKLRKKRGSESFSNISFPLVSVSCIQLYLYLLYLCTPR